LWSMALVVSTVLQEESAKTVTMSSARIVKVFLI